MGAPIEKTLTLMLGGTSLTAGRLCTPPLPWTYYLLEDMMAAPECQGPVRIINTGMGSQTSNFGAAQAALMAPLRPTHVLMEDFGINDCAIGPVSIPQATINFNSMVSSYRAANPNVIIAHQTMSPASALDTSRVNLPTYYNNGLANAALNGLESLDNYYGTVLVPGGWPKPLPPALTVPVPFSITPTPGYVGLPPGAKWDLGGSSFVTSDGFQAVSTANIIGGIFGNPSMSGLVHIEFTPASVAGGYPIFGLANMSFTLVVSLSQTVNGIGMEPNGNVYYNNVLLGNAGIGSVTTGSIIAMEVDVPNKLVYFMQGGARSAGFSFAGVTGTIYPAMSVNNIGTGTSNVQFSSNGDGLHPIWPGSFQTYSYPNILAWARRMMAAYW